MLKQPQKKKRKYKLQREKPINYKSLFMVIGGLAILIIMSVVFSVIGSIPGGPLFRLILQKNTEYAMSFIIIFTLVVNLVSTLLGKALVDTGELNRKTKLIKEHNREKSAVEKLKATDPKAYQKRMIKVKRREASIKKMTQSISMQRMKPSCVTFVPMIALFFFIRVLFNVPTLAVQGAGNPFWFDVIPGGNVGVALTAMNAYPELNILAGYLFPSPDVVYWGSRGFISFTAFYFLCSFSLGTVIQRIFGLSTSGMGGMGGMPGFGGLQNMK